MNLIALVEYGKRLSKAIGCHEAALDDQIKLLKTVSVNRGRIEVTDDAMAERLGGYVQSMRESITAANRLYVRLLRTHPNAPHLGAIYGRFVQDLMNDEALAAQFSMDETGTANGSQAGSKAGSMHGSKVGSEARFSAKHSLTSGGAGSAITMRTYVSGLMRSPSQCYGLMRTLCWMSRFMPKTRTKEVSFLETQFRVGTLVLLLIAAAIFATTHIMLTMTSEEVSEVGPAGLQRFMCVVAPGHARHFALNGMEASRVDTMVAQMERFKTVINNVYVVSCESFPAYVLSLPQPSRMPAVLQNDRHERGSQRDTVLARWRTPDITVDSYVSLFLFVGCVCVTRILFQQLRWQWGVVPATNEPVRPGHAHRG